MSFRIKKTKGPVRPSSNRVTTQPSPVPPVEPVKEIFKESKPTSTVSNRPPPQTRSVTLNTHDYDGKLFEIKSMYPEIGFYRGESTIREAYKNFIEIITSAGDADSANRLSIMMQDSLAGNSNNFDQTNRIDATGIIVFLYELFLMESDKEKKASIVKNLIEQLRDMSTGFCPQGRTHRMLQILTSHYPR